MWEISFGARIPPLAFSGSIYPLEDLSLHIIQIYPLTWEQIYPLTWD